MKYKVGDKFLKEIEVGRVEEGSITPYKMLTSGEGWSEAALDELNRPDITAEEAWEIAEKLIRMSTQKRVRIFGYSEAYWVINSHSFQEIKAKIEAWEAENEVKVGDVVRTDSTKAVVLNIHDEYFEVLVEDGHTEEWYKSKVTKTGRHIDIIQSVLEQIRQEE